MTAPKVWVFWYGSYMNFSVLREVNLEPEAFEVARLSGFDIQIAPRANLVRSDRDCVYGIVATATHEELARLYAHAEKVLGERYLPEVETRDGKWQPAMTYICPSMEPRPPDREYVERIVEAARQLGFPGWYMARLESFGH